MFEPENRRGKAPRSLLDFASEASQEKVRSSAEAAGRRSPRSLIDHLNAMAGERAAPAVETNGGAAAPSAPVAEGKKPGFLSRFGRSVAMTVTSNPGDEAGLRASRHAAADPDRPMIDITLIAGSIWQMRKIILATTALGAIGGILFALSSHGTYVAESKLYIDPREVRLTDSDLSKESLATEALLALVDSQIQVLRSPSVLVKVAADLKLENDAQFGTAPAQRGGFLDGVKVIKDILSPADRPAAGSAAEAVIDPHVLENLADAITVYRDPKTFVVTVEVKSWNAAKSALIANSLVSTFLQEENAAQSNFFQQTTQALDSRLKGLRQSLDEAENAVEKFKADHDIIGAKGELIADNQLLALNDQVAAARSRISDAKAKVEIASRADADAILTGAFPEEITSVTLSELRKQFAEARARLGSLEASLGPRHPQRLAAAQSVDVVRTEISNELRRIAGSNQTELERARKAEQDLIAQLSAQKAQQVNSSSAFIELRELERKAAATRAIYESFLKRAGETGEEEKLTSKNIRVISPAQVPLTQSGTSKRTIVILGLMLGFMAGFGLAILVGVIRSLRLMLSGSEADTRPVVEATINPPDGGGSGSRPAAVVVPEKPVLRRESSAHHAEASTVALAALDTRGPRGGVDHRRYVAPAPSLLDPHVAQVQEELHALRNRVEDYARARNARRR